MKKTEQDNGPQPQLELLYQTPDLVFGERSRMLIDKLKAEHGLLIDNGTLVVGLQEEFLDPDTLFSGNEMVLVDGKSFTKGVYGVFDKKNALPNSASMMIRSGDDIVLIGAVVWQYSEKDEKVLSGSRSLDISRTYFNCGTQADGEFGWLGEEKVTTVEFDRRRIYMDSAFKYPSYTLPTGKDPQEVMKRAQAQMSIIVGDGKKVHLFESDNLGKIFLK